MSEENKITNEEKCLCQNKFFKKFAVVTLGTFVGGFCAINLFAALNKPPMMMPINPMMYGGAFHHKMMMGHYKHDCKCPCHKEMMKKHFEKKAEFAKKMQEKKLEDKN